MWGQKFQAVEYRKIKIYISVEKDLEPNKEKIIEELKNSIKEFEK